MALIGTLRNKMGIGVIIFVGLAIAAFTLGDLLGNNSVLLGQDNNVGEIAGNTISLWRSIRLPCRSARGIIL